MTDRRARSGRLHRVSWQRSRRIRGGGFVAVESGVGREGSARVRDRVAPSCRRPWCPDGESRRSVPPPTNVRGEGTPPGFIHREILRAAPTPDQVRPG